jgi:phage baseplate assembly protein W
MSEDNSFLGTGWSFPPTFGPGGSDVHMVSEEDDIEQSLAILLATRRGERVMQDEYGGALSEFLFADVSQSLIGRVRGLVGDAILLYEPRITMNDLDVSVSPVDAGLLLISIDYTIRATNSRYNMVYPFYLNEAASPAG